jgi:hypothetical protein
MGLTRPWAPSGTRHGFGGGRNGYPNFGEGARTSRRFGFRVSDVPGGVEGKQFCSSEQDRAFRKKDIVRIRRDAWQARKVPGLAQPWCGPKAHGFRGSAGNTAGWPSISSERSGEVRNPVAGHHFVTAGRLPVNIGVSSRTDARFLETAKTSFDSPRGGRWGGCGLGQTGGSSYFEAVMGLSTSGSAATKADAKGFGPSSGGETRTETSEGEAVSRETSQSSCSLRLCGTGGSATSVFGPAKCARGGHTFGEPMAGRGKPLGR